MAFDIAQCLLANPEQRQLGLRGESSFSAGRAERIHDAGPFGQSASLGLEGRRQAKVVEQRRPEISTEATKLVRNAERPVTRLRDRLAAVTAACSIDDPGLEALEAELAASEVARNTAFRGAMLRSSLLTTYGFSVLGDKAQEAAIAAFITAVAFVLLGLAGLAFVFATRRSASGARRATSEPAVA